MKIKGLDFPYNLLYKLELSESEVIKNKNGTYSLIQKIGLKPRLLLKILDWIIGYEKN